MTIYTYGEEITRKFGGCDLLVRPEHEGDDEETITGYQYCVVYGEKETDWVDGRSNDIEKVFGEASDWALEIVESECEDALEAKGHEDPYAWMVEGLGDEVATWDDSEVETTVKHHAEMAYGYGNTVEDFVRETLTLDQFLAASDYKRAVSAIKAIRDSRSAAIKLAEVVTPAEVSEDMDVKADTVRDACQNGWITSRKSGSTWLMLRKDAESRWGNKA